MSNLNIDDLIKKYSPIVYIHPDEKYYPCSIDWLLRYSTLIDFNLNTRISPVTQKDLFDTAQRYDFQRRADGDVILSFDKEVFKGEHPLSSVPCYAYSRIMQDGKIQIQYIFLFAYNGEYLIAGLENAGYHPGDIEHITAELSSTGELLRIFYSAHGTKDGKWLNAKNVTFEDGHPVAFNALNGHGLYPTLGLVYRLGGFANDHLDKGLRWEPEVNIFYSRTDNRFNIDTMGWTVFNSRIGGSPDKPNTEGITGLPDKAWMQYGDNPDEGFYDPPPIISQKSSKILDFSQDLIIFIIIYFLIATILLKLTSKIVKSEYFKYTFKQHIITAILAFLIYLIYKKLGSSLIKKFIPA